ncbi:MAG TPA: GTPase-associated system all-helical protein GASH [Nocardioides sp.]|nr:GTPase-associated system all-helical protein GASH [Nocardioides sp.]
MDLIGELLHASLLTEIGDQEDRVTRVREAAAELATTLSRDALACVPGAIIAAVDEASLVSSTTMQLADQALTAKWETFHNAFPDVPAEILRATLLAAVAQAAASDPRITTAGWYVLRSATERLGTARWTAVLDGLTAEWNETASATIDDTWSPPAAIATVRMPSIAKFEDKRIPLTNSTARKEAARIEEAGGNYSTFATELQAIYTKHVDTLVGAAEVLAGTAQQRSIDALRSFANELGSRLRETLAAQEAVVESIRLRSDLLWWYETQFSPTMQLPYEKLQPPELPIVAALDLHRLMPEVAPLAAEHLLAVVVSTLTPGQELTLEDLASASAAERLPAADTIPPGTVLAALRVGEATPLWAPQAKVAPATAAVLLFRDLQVRRLLGRSAGLHED